MPIQSSKDARKDADQRWMRIQALGSIAYDASREQRIAAKHDWPYLLVPVDALTREAYEQLQRPDEPLSPITGLLNGKPFYAKREDLRALWRADSRRRA